MSSTETEKYTLRELVRNNCACCASEKACDICNIHKQVALAVKEWLEQKRKEMFIDTVSSMDCEMSAVREETFDALLKELSL